MEVAWKQDVPRPNAKRVFECIGEDVTSAMSTWFWQRLLWWVRLQEAAKALSAAKESATKAAIELTAAKQAASDEVHTAPKEQCNTQTHHVLLSGEPEMQYCSFGGQQSSDPWAVFICNGLHPAFSIRKPAESVIVTNHPVCLVHTYSHMLTRIRNSM